MKLKKTTVEIEWIVVVLLLTVSLLLGFVAGDDEKDKQECTNSLVGLATCLPYVGGNTKSPTPDCCNGLKQVLKDDKKCLCLIIKDRNDPQIGININVTLALGLPTVCQSPANISKCPGSPILYSFLLIRYCNFIPFLYLTFSNKSCFW